MRTWKGFRIGRMMVFGVLIAALAGAVVMLLWNALLPALFGLPAIGWLQALGLLLLARLLFGRKGWGGDRHHRGPKGFWRERFRRKIEAMSTEEREAFFARRPGCRRWYGENGGKAESTPSDTPDEARGDAPGPAQSTSS